MAKRPLPKNNTKDVLMVNQLTVRKSAQFPELQQAVASATGGSSGGKSEIEKDDTLTKDEFNSGFQDGVGQIKEGFSGLGAGLGPLQVIVDFVKSFASKIGNIFTIFKGFFNILLSIPKAIANAFKKKDKDDDKKDKKKGKLKNALEKGKKKEREKDRKASGKSRAGFARFATALKPMLIVGAILAISAGLILLYNWLVGKGLFVFFDNLLTGIRIGLLDLKTGFALVFKGEESEEFRKLEAEKAELILEKKVLPNLTEADRAILADENVSKEQKAIRLQKLATAKGGVSQDAVFRALSRKEGNVADTLQAEFNLEPIILKEINEFVKEGLDFTKDFDTAKVTEELKLKTRLATESNFTTTETVRNALGVPVSEITRGTRVFTTSDGQDLTIDKLLAELQKQDDDLTEEKLRQILLSAPGVGVADDGTTIVQTGVGGADELGRVVVERNEFDELVTADKEGGSLGKTLLESESGFVQGIGKVVRANEVVPTNNPFFILKLVGDLLGTNTIEGEKLDEESLEAASEDIVNQPQLDKKRDELGEEIQALYIREQIKNAGIEGERIGLANQGKSGKLRDQALIEDLARFSEVDGDANRLGIGPFRRDSFEFSDGTDMNSAEIEESLVTRIQSSLELRNREDAQIIYNTYMDNNQNMIQNIAPTSDTGQNTGKPIYLPDVGYLPTSI